jgi:hypothetical protein
VTSGDIAVCTPRSNQDLLSPNIDPIWPKTNNRDLSGGFGSHLAFSKDARDGLGSRQGPVPTARDGSGCHQGPTPTVRYQTGAGICNFFGVVSSFGAPVFAGPHSRPLPPAQTRVPFPAGRRDGTQKLLTSRKKVQVPRVVWYRPARERHGRTAATMLGPCQPRRPRAPARHHPAAALAGRDGPSRRHPWAALVCLTVICRRL